MSSNTKKPSKFSDFKPTMLGEQPASRKATPTEINRAEEVVLRRDNKPAIEPLPAKKPLVSASFRVSSDVLSSFDDLAYELRHKTKRELFDEALQDLVAKYRQG